MPLVIWLYSRWTVVHGRVGFHGKEARRNNEDGPVINGKMLSHSGKPSSGLKLTAPAPQSDRPYVIAFLPQGFHS